MRRHCDGFNDALAILLVKIKKLLLKVIYSYISKLLEIIFGVKARWSELHALTSFLCHK